MGRNNSGKTESWWTAEMNTQLKEKFHLENDLQSVFIDSWAKQEWNLGDTLQQEAFDRETTKLWEIVSSNGKFEFKTIEDVINDLNHCQEENECLKGEIQEKLTQLSEALEEEKAKNIEQDISILNNEAKNQEQDSAISDLDNLPLGSIIPWVNKPDQDTLHVEEIPDGWALCNGSTIAEGVWKGEKTPNLNGEGRFLRGGQPHEVLNLEEHMVEDHTHIDNGHTHTDSGHDHGYKEWFVNEYCGLDGCNGGPGLQDSKTTVGHANIQTSTSNLGGLASGNKGSETRPTNMRVMWIMKVW